MNAATPNGADAALRFVRDRCGLRPRVGIVLGSGLGDSFPELDTACRLPYDEIPGLAASTAIGHAGELVLGRLSGTAVAILRGRVHVYEGHPVEAVTRCVELLHGLGVERLILSCAAGGLNLRFAPGQLMLIEDHLDLQWLQIAAQFSPDGLARGDRTTIGTTNRELNAGLASAASRCGVRLATGVYAAVTGPNYETRAEQRFLAQVADAVGMSTVPEIVAANRLGLPVAAVAMITNICNPDAPEKTSGEEVIAVATRAAPGFAMLVRAYMEATMANG